MNSISPSSVCYFCVARTEHSPFILVVLNDGTPFCVDWIAILPRWDNKLRITGKPYQLNFPRIPRMSQKQYGTNETARSENRSVPFIPPEKLFASSFVCHFYCSGRFWQRQWLSCRQLFMHSTRVFSIHSTLDTNTVPNARRQREQTTSLHMERTIFLDFIE